MAGWGGWRDGWLARPYAPKGALCRASICAVSIPRRRRLATSSVWGRGWGESEGEGEGERLRYRG